MSRRWYRPTPLVTVIAEPVVLLDVMARLFVFSTDVFRRFGLEVRHESLMMLGQIGIAPLGEDALVRKLNSHHVTTNVCAYNV